MIVDIVYETVQRLMGKFSAGGFLSDTDFNKFGTLSQSDKLEFELNSSQSTYNLETVSNFKKTIYLPVIGGVVEQPNDYRYFESAKGTDFSTGGARPVAFEELSTDDWNWRLASAHQPPTMSYPALVQRDNHLEIAPQTMQTIQLTYIINPPDVVWGWQADNNRKVYYEPNSTDFTFGESDIPDLVYRILVMAGVQIRDKELINAAIAERQRTGRP